MPESTLNAMYKDLQADVGFFLGFGRGPDFDDPIWDSKQSASIERSVKGGLRNWYFCGHDWSFLQPVSTLTLLSGSRTLQLPDDCGGVEGQITFSTPTNNAWWRPIDFGGIGRVYQAYQQYPTRTGWPELCCVEALKGTTINRSNRMTLHFWPEADQDYVIQFRYYVSPDYLSGSFPYAYGGPQHAETLLESCLAVAEKLLDDAATVHAAEFAARLQVSMELDRRNKPQTLGYNRDESDLLHGRRWGGRDPWLEQRVTYDGAVYGA